MPDKKRYKKDKDMRDLYRKDLLNNQSFSEFRKALKNLTKNKVK